jgi:hypothetical protein
MVDPRSLIYIEAGAPSFVIREISEVSEVVRGMRGFGINRICFPAEVSVEMARLIEDCTSQKQAT